MAAYKKIESLEGGWSESQFPVSRGFKHACCDCGLVHDMEFDVVEVTRTNPDGTFETKPLDSEKYCVEFRMRRSARSTAMVRRHLRRSK